jgi:thioredoxin reductase (NADPH)
MDAIMLDSLPQPGGQLATLYPEKYIYDMPGFPKVLAGDLAGMMYEQATMHRKQQVEMGFRVENLQFDPEDDLFHLRDSNNRSFIARTVLVTTGAGAFRPNRLKVSDIEHLDGRSVHYFVKDKSVFKDKPIVNVGGGDSALDWVINLHGIASEISLVHRRDKFRAHEDSVNKLNALTDVKQYLFYEVKELEIGALDELEQVKIENNKTGETLILRADHLIVNLGFVADMGPVKNWDIELQGQAIKVNSHMETSRPGIYAAGDVTTYPGKLKLIATATSEAAIAVNAAKQRIDPTQGMQPAHSSSMYDK